MNLDDVVSLEEAAESLGRSPEAFRKAAQRGTLEARHVGRQWITTRDAAARYVASVQTRRRVRRPPRPT